MIHSNRRVLLLELNMASFHWEVWSDAFISCMSATADFSSIDSNVVKSAKLASDAWVVGVRAWSQL